ncbi:hypothetical protein CCP2SC5_180018 [Azospirillaceae bacterium]
MTAEDGVLLKRSVTISGHSTSVSMERLFWVTLKDIAIKRRKTLQALIEEVDQTRAGNLSSALRVYILKTLLESEQNGSKKLDGSRDCVPGRGGS